MILCWGKNIWVMCNFKIIQFTRKLTHVYLKIEFYCKFVKIWGKYGQVEIYWKWFCVPQIIMFYIKDDLW
jgi:hypothetical protein